jgi:mitogen-activated protein kinase kinase
MASPAPLLRPPIPGSRNTSVSRAPKLGLAIPPSPHSRPLNPASHSNAIPPLQIPPRQAPPKLSLATPMGSHGVPQETTRNAARGKLPPLQVTGLSTAQGGGSSDDSAHSRSNSNGASNNYSTSTTASSYSASLAGLIGGQTTQDPISAAGSLYSSSSAGGFGGSNMERDGSMQGVILPDLEKLSLEKGRPLDVEDLDDAGWKVAAKEDRIVELGSLGEGAGGAVNRCILKGGKTVFALKVGNPLLLMASRTANHLHRSSQQTPTQTSRNRLYENFRSTRTAPRPTYAAITAHSSTRPTAPLVLVWNTARVAL